jgi:hypothetical protein
MLLALMGQDRQFIGKILQCRRISMDQPEQCGGISNFDTS